MSTAKKTFPVVGMHCASCASLIKKRLEKLDGVESCVVNYGTEKAQVSFDNKKINVTDMNKEIDKLGYSLVENEKPMNMSHSMHEDHDMMTPISSDKSIKEQKLVELSKLKRHVQIIIPMIAISILSMLWDIEFLHHLIPIFATYALFVIGTPYLQG